MKSIIFNSIIVLALISSACSGSKGTSQSDSSENSSTEQDKNEKAREEAIFADGYKKCKVVDKGGVDGCGILLEDVNGGQLYNPVAWDEDFMPYKKTGNLVYIKFRSSKISQTSCLSSMPIIVDEMKLIE